MTNRFQITRSCLSLLLALIIQTTVANAQMTVNTFSNATHMAAATLEQNFNFPDDVSGYGTVLMNIALTCPAGGCDPWDRYAHILVEHEGEDYEIGRYITPYGNDWCTWQLDVSEYRQLLSGDVKLKSYIETWSNGWDLTLSFDFMPGTPDYTNTKVSNIWVEYNKRYGDTIAYSNDIPAVEASIDPNAEEVIMRVAITGHGQGNFQNAAEFSQKTHEVKVDGSTVFNHYLWKDDCNVNPCSPQGGTWTFSRAGWCPGQEVPPTDVDITSYITPGSTTLLDYKLEDYFNTCSPWNPDCVPGGSCPECTYNGGTHTEPIYKLAIQLIQKSNSDFSTAIESPINRSEMEIYPSPGHGMINLTASLFEEARYLEIFNAAGQRLDQQMVQGREINQQLDYSYLEAGLYTVVIRTENSYVSSKLIIQ